MKEILKKTSIPFGIAGAILFAITYFSFWKIDLSLFVSPVIYIVYFIILGLCIYAQVKARQLLNGVIDFTNAFKVYMVTIVISLIGFFVAPYLIFNVLDVPAKDRLQKIVIDQAFEMMEKVSSLLGNTNEIPLDRDMLEQTMELQGSSYDLQNLIISTIIVFIMFTIAGLISSAIIKRNPTVEFD